ncbi:MAG TPA: TIGR04086 family membrane protein [Tissierellaceae bacterium]|nr:TIGR04086 family membrane protein [Tissierellaceae bacterium]
MKSKLYPNNWLKGLAIAFITTFILLLLVAFVLRFTDIKESSLTLLNNLVLTVSIVIASAIIGRKIKEKGWLNGAIIGFLYFFLIVILNLLFNRPLNFGLFLLTKLLLATILGAIGGMIGINLP